MTLEKALKMLERIVDQDEESGRPDCVKAERLGIEALKRIKRARDRHCPASSELLIGETVEEQRSQ